MFTGHKTLSLMLNIYSVHNPVAVAKKLNGEFFLDSKCK
jgi:hypothetical protein